LNDDVAMNEIIFNKLFYVFINELLNEVMHYLTIIYFYSYENELNFIDCESKRENTFSSSDELMNEKWTDHDNISSDDLTNNSDRESLLSNDSIIEVFSDEEEPNFDSPTGRK
jgi:hypothetical protein